VSYNSNQVVKKYLLGQKKCIGARAVARALSNSKEE